MGAGSVRVVGRTRRRDVGIALAVLAVGAVIAGIVGAGGWPGAPSGCIEAGQCDCEVRRGGLVAQPVNTFSNLGFVIVGLWVLAAAGIRSSGPNRIANEPIYRRLFGGIAIFLGVGSMLFHATMTEWGGWADLVSIHLLVTFVLLYDLAVLARRSTRWFLRTWTTANVALGVVLWVMDNSTGKYVIGVLLVATVVVDLRVSRPSDGAVTRNRRLLGAALGVYLAGQVVWLLSGDGGPWCSPGSVAQGHALWHLTGAAAVALLYSYLAGETDSRRAVQLVG
jgi:hypothetical protein